uniref:Uncharacterized protein n=1 Tax=Anguilla anguilla TaxID=7936 RepID=A0A0E9TPE0_ANGAN
MANYLDPALLTTKLFVTYCAFCSLSICSTLAASQSSFCYTLVNFTWEDMTHIPIKQE